jgi:hypothetical protein
VTFNLTESFALCLARYFPNAARSAAVSSWTTSCLLFRFVSLADIGASPKQLRIADTCTSNGFGATRNLEGEKGRWLMPKTYFAWGRFSKFFIS